MTHGQTGAGEWATIKDPAMAYPDDKSMTKMGGNVHFPVMQTAYALWSHLQYLEEGAG